MHNRPHIDGDVIAALRGRVIAHNENVDEPFRTRLGDLKKIYQRGEMDAVDRHLDLRKGEFEESQHRRDASGRFAPKGGGASQRGGESVPRTNRVREAPPRPAREPQRVQVEVITRPDPAIEAQQRQILEEMRRTSRNTEVDVIPESRFSWGVPAAAYAATAYLAGKAAAYPDSMPRSFLRHLVGPVARTVGEIGGAVSADAVTTLQNKRPPKTPAPRVSIKDAEKRRTRWMRQGGVKTARAAMWAADQKARIMQIPADFMLRTYSKPGALGQRIPTAKGRAGAFLVGGSLAVGGLAGFNHSVGDPIGGAGRFLDSMFPRRVTKLDAMLDLAKGCNSPEEIITKMSDKDDLEKVSWRGLGRSIRAGMSQGGSDRLKTVQSRAANISGIRAARTAASSAAARARNTGGMTGSEIKAADSTAAAARFTARQAGTKYTGRGRAALAIGAGALAGAIGYGAGRIWDETKVKRDERGRFAEKAGGVAAAVGATAALVATGRANKGAAAVAARWLRDTADWRKLDPSDPARGKSSPARKEMLDQQAKAGTGNPDAPNRLSTAERAAEKAQASDANYLKRISKMQEAEDAAIDRYRQTVADPVQYGISQVEEALGRRLRGTGSGKTGGGTRSGGLFQDEAFIKARPKNVSEDDFKKQINRFANNKGLTGKEPELKAILSPKQQEMLTSVVKQADSAKTQVKKKFKDWDQQTKSVVDGDKALSARTDELKNESDRLRTEFLTYKKDAPDYAKKLEDNQARQKAIQVERESLVAERAALAKKREMLTAMKARVAEQGSDAMPTSLQVSHPFEAGKRIKLMPSKLEKEARETAIKAAHTGRLEASYVARWDRAGTEAARQVREFADVMQREAQQAGTILPRSVQRLLDEAIDEASGFNRDAQAAVKTALKDLGIKVSPTKKIKVTNADGKEVEVDVPTTAMDRLYELVKNTGEAAWKAGGDTAGFVMNHWKKISVVLGFAGYDIIADGRLNVFGLADWAKANNKPEPYFNILNPGSKEETHIWGAYRNGAFVTGTIYRPFDAEYNKRLKAEGRDEITPGAKVEDIERRFRGEASGQKDGQGGDGRQRQVNVQGAFESDNDAKRAMAAYFAIPKDKRGKAGWTIEPTQDGHNDFAVQFRTDNSPEAREFGNQASRVLNAQADAAKSRGDWNLALGTAVAGTHSRMMDMSQRTASVGRIIGFSGNNWDTAVSAMQRFKAAHPEVDDDHIKRALGVLRRGTGATVAQMRDAYSTIGSVRSAPSGSSASSSSGGTTVERGTGVRPPRVLVDNLMTRYQSSAGLGGNDDDRRSLITENIQAEFDSLSEMEDRRARWDLAAERARDAMDEAYNLRRSHSAVDLMKAAFGDAPAGGGMGARRPFDETKIRRQGKGSDKGGEFAPKAGGTAGLATAQRGGEARQPRAGGAPRSEGRKPQAASPPPDDTPEKDDRSFWEPTRFGQALGNAVGGEAAWSIAGKALSGITRNTPGLKQAYIAGELGRAMKRATMIQGAKWGASAAGSIGGEVAGGVAGQSTYKPGEEPDFYTPDQSFAELGVRTAFSIAGSAAGGIAGAVGGPLGAFAGGVAGNMAGDELGGAIYRLLSNPAPLRAAVTSQMSNTYGADAARRVSQYL